MKSFTGKNWKGKTMKSVILLFMLLTISTIFSTISSAATLRQGLYMKSDGLLGFIVYGTTYQKGQLKSLNLVRCFNYTSVEELKKKCIYSTQDFETYACTENICSGRHLKVELTIIDSESFHRTVNNPSAGDFTHNTAITPSKEDL